MEIRTRAFKPSLTMDSVYEWDTDRKDIYGRDPEEVERRIVTYIALLGDTPDEETSEEDEEGLTRALELDWAGTVRQLREEGFESVLGCVRSGNHLESPF